jgi:hypothetical protein
MSPQPTKQQLEHALSNIRKRVDAKKLECHALAAFRDHAGLAVADLIQDCGLIPEHCHALQDATGNFFTAKLHTALVDLEELELNLRAYSQMSSGIVGATMIPPTNSKKM